MKKRLLCLALVFAMTATQAIPVAASSRKQELQTQKSQTQSKLSEAESQVNTLESKKNALMGQINSTQQELVTIMTQIDMLKEEIKDKETDIKETQEDLKRGFSICTKTAEQIPGHRSFWNLTVLPTCFPKLKITEKCTTMTEKLWKK